MPRVALAQADGRFRLPDVAALESRRGTLVEGGGETDDLGDGGLGPARDGRRQGLAFPEQDPVAGTKALAAMETVEVGALERDSPHAEGEHLGRAAFVARHLPQGHGRLDPSRSE